MSIPKATVIYYCPHFPWDENGHSWIEGNWAHTVRVNRPCRVGGNDMYPGDELRVCGMHHKYLEQMADLSGIAEQEAEQVEGLLPWTDEWFEAVKRRVGPSVWALFGEIGR